MSTTSANVITRYFAADARRDSEAIVALFTADAVVVDEGQTWRGTGAIRNWREGPASTYQYTTAVHSTERSGADTYRVTGRLTGTFRGGRPTWRGASPSRAT